MEKDYEYEPCDDYGQDVRYERRYARQSDEQARLESLLVRD